MMVSSKNYIDNLYLSFNLLKTNQINKKKSVHCGKGNAGIIVPVHSPKPILKPSP